ncbi:unnamed protein product, partial [Penicillium viridicatum]
MLPSNPSSRRTAYKAFRPATPLEQASQVWELGNVPIAPGFYEADQDEELAGRILPQIQLTTSGFNASSLGTRTPFFTSSCSIASTPQSLIAEKTSRTPASIFVEKTTFA